MPARPPNAKSIDGFRRELKSLEKSVRRIVRAHDMQSRSLAKACGLTSAQLVVCKGVAELGEVTSTALSAYADISPATMVTILDNLEERGLIQRYRSLTDRRIVHVRLTNEGIAVLKHAPEPLPADIAARLEALDPAHRNEMVAVLEEFSRLMERTKPETGAQNAP